MRSGLRSIAMAVVAAAVLSACASTAPPSSGLDTPATSRPTVADPTTVAPAPPTTPPTSPTTTNASNPTTTVPATGASPVVEVAPGEPIQIRAIQSIDGSLASVGLDQVRGIELAIADFGPIHGHAVELGDVLDDRCSPEGGSAAAAEVAALATVVGVIGTSCSAAAVAAASVLSDAGIPIVSGSATSPHLTTESLTAPGSGWRPGFFRTAPNDLYQGVAAGRFASEELGADVAVAVHDEHPYTAALAEAFVGEVRALGGTARSVLCNKCDEDDIDEVLAAVAGENPDAVFLPLFRPEGDLIVERYRGVPGLASAAILAGAGLAVDDFLTRPESAGLYFTVPEQDLAGYTSVTGVTYPELLDRYRDAYGEPPPVPDSPFPPFHAHAYDATIVLLTAVRDSARDAGDTLQIDREALRRRIRLTTGLAGLTGDVACDTFGDCHPQTIALVRNDDPANPEAVRANVLSTFRRAALTADRCRPAVTEADPLLSAEAQATTSDGIEAWALIFNSWPLPRGTPARIPVGVEAKIVWRVTGQGDAVFDAVGPEGDMLSPDWGPAPHLGSNWARPGDEWGTGWIFPEPGCWTFRVRRAGEVVATLAVEAYG